MPNRKSDSHRPLKSFDARQIAAILERGFERLRAGDVDAAGQAAEEALRVAQRHDGAFNLAGLVSLQRGNLADAIRRFKEAIGLGPAVANYHVNLAVAHRRAHQHEEAIAACHRAIELQSDYVLAYLNLGTARFATESYGEALTAFEQAFEFTKNDEQRALLLAYRGDAQRELGRLQQAIASYQRALKLSPDLAHAVGNLGLTQLGVGQPESALQLAERATQLEPHSAGVWMNLGTTLRALDRLDDAMESYGKAFELDPESAELACQIASVWLEVGDVAQAAQWCEKALELEPDRVEALCGLAATILEAGDSAGAVERFRAVVAEHPAHADAWLGLARAVWSDGDATEAVEACRTAVELRPEHAGSLAQLATILASAGDVEAANEANRTALDVNPRCIPALANLAQNLRGRLETSDATQMTNLLEVPWMRDGGRAALHFGLAHHRDGLGEFDDAAQHAAQANDYHTKHKQERGWDYQPEEYEQYVNRLIEVFSPSYFQRIADYGTPNETPVFIVGMPRSGTTLTEQIIASHPLAFGAGERNFAARTFARLPQLVDQPDRTPVDCVSDISSEQVTALADWHLAQLGQLVEKSGQSAGEVVRVLDKMPENYSLLGWIATMFPAARIIHCRRDPRDVAVSCWMTQFKEIRWAFDVDHIAHRIQQYQRLMNHWRSVLPLSMLEIDYEDTVADTAAQTAKLLQHVGLEWDDACLNFHETERLIRTASVTQVRQPIYRRSLERWRRYEKPLHSLFQQIKD